jgi:2-oxoglutarate ferredoxin oxidoreductase subunit beta
MVNNMIYGMTGGQVAATTPLGTWTTTTPYGSYEPPLDAFRLLASAGARYVARWTTAHMSELTESLKTALTTKGFSFVEAVSQCPTAFGRRRGFKNVKEMLRWFKTQSVPIDEAEAVSAPELGEKIAVGEFHSRNTVLTLSESIHQVTKRAGKQ